jgi:hypothetical protein
MFGAWIPRSVIAAMSAPPGFVATGLVVQWTHRALAALLLVLAIAGIVDAHRQAVGFTTRRLAWCFALLVCVNQRAARGSSCASSCPRLRGCIKRTDCSSSPSPCCAPFGHGGSHRDNEVIRPGAWYTQTT